MAQPSDDASLGGVEQRPVERVGHVAHQHAGGVPGELGVGVQSDDIAYGAQQRAVADDIGEGRGGIRRAHRGRLGRVAARALAGLRSGGVRLDLAVPPINNRALNCSNLPRLRS